MKKSKKAVKQSDKKNKHSARKPAKKAKAREDESDDLGELVMPGQKYPTPVEVIF